MDGSSAVNISGRSDLVCVLPLCNGKIIKRRTKLAFAFQFQCLHCSLFTSHCIIHILFWIIYAIFLFVMSKCIEFAFFGAVVITILFFSWSLCWWEMRSYMAALLMCPHALGDNLCRVEYDQILYSWLWIFLQLFGYYYTIILLYECLRPKDIK